MKLESIIKTATNNFGERVDIYRFANGWGAQVATLNPDSHKDAPISDERKAELAATKYLAAPVVFVGPVAATLASKICMAKTDEELDSALEELQSMAPFNIDEYPELREHILGEAAKVIVGSMLKEVLSGMASNDDVAENHTVH
ncbi:hypothetical protein [Candidimonas nitroreducens]|uniref:Uncharacterized protein n=1 Tax=Candidimonas nitroreducens TaxID=683354 RepID=A0A225M1M3_9BURK|nr:hypothetical protein [Candidimonas nitroreducens]OWT55255.1 hypothetical protein CEY11_21330 [Candidimonas nitroreducens]